MAGYYGAEGTRSQNNSLQSPTADEL